VRVDSFLLVVLVVVWREELGEPAALAVHPGAEVGAHGVAVVDAVRRDAVPAVEARGALHRRRLTVDVAHHGLHARQREPAAEQPRQPPAAQLRRVQVRHALHEPHERHVRDQRVDRAAAAIEYT
jgi:hypothetical protein